MYAQPEFLRPLFLIWIFKCFQCFNLPSFFAIKISVETIDPVISAKFANISAALSVRSSRLSSIPSRADVEKFIL